MSRLSLQADHPEVVQEVKVEEAAVVEVVVVELDVVAEAEAEVEIVARQITRMLHAIIAKRQDTSLIIARSQSQYQKTTTKAIKL